MERKRYLKENIDFFMDKKNMSANYLAELSGMYRSVLINIINGITKNPDILTIVKIANALRISVDDLLYKDFRKDVRK